MLRSLPLVAGAALTLDTMIPNTSEEIKGLIVVGLFLILGIGLFLGNSPAFDKVLTIVGLVVGYYFGRKESG